MTKPELIVAEARKYIGVKWRHRGRKPWAVDCIGLVVLSVRAAGIEMRDRTDYGREPWKDGLRREMVDHFGAPVSAWQPGDIAVMRWEQHTEPGHVGILTDYANGGLGLVHSFSRIAVTEHRLDEAWRSLILEVYRP